MAAPGIVQLLHAFDGWIPAERRDAAVWRERNANQERLIEIGFGRRRRGLIQGRIPEIWIATQPAQRNANQEWGVRGLFDRRRRLIEQDRGIDAASSRLTRPLLPCRDDTD
jgi:hypothetical protein